MNGCVAYSNGWTTSIGSTATGSHIMFDIKPATGEWEVYIGDSGAGFNCPAILILRYTKTTDSPVASGEKIVGQWIDGKPVYEKVLTLQNVAYNWNTTNSYGISNIDHVVSSSVRIHYKNGSSEWWFTPYCKGSSEYVTFTFDEHDFRAIWSNTGEIQNIYETEIILRYTKTS